MNAHGNLPTLPLSLALPGAEGEGASDYDSLPLPAGVFNCSVDAAGAILSPAGPTPQMCSKEGRATCEAEGLLRLQRLTVRLAVSQDEEYVSLHLLQDRVVVDCGARNHNFLLLTLARRRLEDAGLGLPETSCGWTHVDDLSYEAHVTQPKLNTDVFRIRHQLRACHVVGADDIIERRLSSRQLRIGIGRLSIVSL